MRQFRMLADRRAICWNEKKINDSIGGRAVDCSTHSGAVLLKDISKIVVGQDTVVFEKHKSEVAHLAKLSVGCTAWPIFNRRSHPSSLVIAPLTSSHRR